MNYFKGLVSNVKGFYDGINPATLTGAIDVIVVRQEDGTYVGSPFHVRFGKLGVLRAREKVVDISVNGKEVDLHMKLGDAGEAFFVEECSEENFPTELATSPIPSYEMLLDKGMKELHEAAAKEGKHTENEKEINQPNNELESQVAGEIISANENRLLRTASSEEVILADQKSNFPDINYASPSMPKKAESGAEGESTESPSKRPQIVVGSSESIPIPQCNTTRMRLISESDDQLSIVGSPDSVDYLSRDEYPLSDMDMPIGDSVVNQSTLKNYTDPRMVLSDTEAELGATQHKDRTKNADDVTWEWGELPQGPVKPDRGTQMESGRKKRLEKTSKSKSKCHSEGLYLDDVLQADKEVAALYLNRHSKIEIDADSGYGQDSNPVSPIDVFSRTETEFTNEAGSPPQVLLSLCGDLKRGKVDTDKFMDALVSFDEFCKSPSILNDPKLVIKMGKKYYNWQVAAPYLMALVAYGKPLCRETVKSLKQQHMPRKRKGWFSWRSTYDEQESSDEDEISARKSERLHHRRSLKSDIVPESIQISHVESKGKQKERYKKVIRLTSNQLSSLGLQEGENSITFSVTTQYQGTASCTARIFLWNFYDSIVISDIDGTITRSDVFGQILPYVGKDWSQKGVTNLFSNIERNGYKFVYLSARAIGQAELTRNFLKSIQQGEDKLPEGPMLLSPTSLVKAFQKEVIEKKPEEFKIACLKDIKTIFPSTRNPFYSGFGNRVNDVWAYRALGIPISRIFTINYKGEIKHELTNAFSSSYEKLGNLVDQMFPPILHHDAMEEICSDYSSFNYWKINIPNSVDSISLSDDENIGL